MFDYITKSIIPIIVLVIVTYGMIKGRKVYEWFIEGAKDGLKVCLNIFPYLLAMLVAVNIFREAKKMGFICKMNTNASLITEKNYEELADIFSEFFISIHSDDEKIHDELTQREGSLKNTITGIRLLKSKNAPTMWLFSYSVINYCFQDYSNFS